MLSRSKRREIETKIYDKIASRIAEHKPMIHNNATLGIEILDDVMKIVDSEIR